MEFEMAKEPSILEKLKDLEAQAAQLREQAKSGALEKANQAVDELNALGFTYKLVEGVGTKSAVNHTPSDKPCSVCGWKTDPPHDARSHRGKDKRPFTDAELKEKGFVKV